MRRAAQRASRDRRTRATPSVPTAAPARGRRRGGAARRRPGAVAPRTPPKRCRGAGLRWRRWSRNSALDRCPGLGPGRVVLAGDVRTTVEALGDGCVPVPDLAEVRLVIGVVGGAETRVRRLRAGELVRRRLTEPL